MILASSYNRDKSFNETTITIPQIRNILWIGQHKKFDLTVRQLNIKIYNHSMYSDLITKALNQCHTSVGYVIDNHMFKKYYFGQHSSVVNFSQTTI
jgi:hypothetical protein